MRLRIAALLIALPALLSCLAHRRPVIVPLETVAHAKRPDGRAPTLIVLLPGRGSRAGDFDHMGFTEMARESGVDADLMEVDLHLGYYMDGSFSRRLWEDVVAPARAAGYAHVWLVGLSLGGIGAIGFAREHPDALAGLVLLSPYLGPEAVGEEIRAAGGLATWNPTYRSDADTFETFIVQNWEFLKQVSQRGGGPPVLHLGYGSGEHLEPLFELLADSLPPAQVIRVPGSHRWKTWRALWQDFLVRGVFDRPAISPVARGNRSRPGPAGRVAEGTPQMVYPSRVPRDRTPLRTGQTP
jgi:pimeloyl-ACP methyl ester carboxylesterase